MSSTLRVALATFATCLASAGAAQAAILAPVQNDATGATQLAKAMASKDVSLGGASFVSAPGPGAASSATGTAKISTVFPSQGSPSYAAITTGKALTIEPSTTPGWVSPVIGTNLGTSVPTRSQAGSPNLAKDVTVLQVPFTVPSNANCLTFDLQMLSGEFPTYANQPGNKYNDAFIAELDQTTWKLSQTGSNPTVVTAPDNFAFDSANKPLTVNTTSFAQANAGGTGYKNYGATPLLAASKQVTPGIHTLYLSLFDTFDNAYDTAVLLDALRVGFVPTPSKNCKPGAQPVLYSLTAAGSGTDYVGTTHAITATVKTSAGAPVPQAKVQFTVAGANPGVTTVTADKNGVATLDLAGPNPGQDTIAACYDNDGDGTCEATASTTYTFEARPELSVGTPSAAVEGNAGTTSVTFPVTLAKPATADVTVGYATADGSAAAGTDYTATSGTLTIAKGQTTGAFTVLVNGDTLVEGDETFKVALSSPTVATLDVASATATITNDDTTTLTATGTAVKESAGKAAVTVTSTLKSQQPITVEYATADGTARAGDDYTAAAGTATIPAGETSTTIEVAIAGDTLVEGDEVFSVGFTNPSPSATIGGGAIAGVAAAAPGASVDITIQDDDVATLSVAGVTVGESAGKAALTVASTLKSSKPITVDFTTADGTAVAGDDYTATSGTATIPAGASSARLDVPVLDDQVAESEETFAVKLAKASTGSVIDPKAASADVTITDDDIAPTPSPTPAPTVSPVVPAPAPTPVPDQGGVLGERVDSPGAAAVLCGRSIVLLDVMGAGRKVRIAGLVSATYVGRKVTISAGSQAVGTTTVASDGSFAKDVSLPAKSVRSTIRYSAKVAGKASRALKLERKLVITKRNGLTINGRITASRLSDLPKTVTFYRQLTCTKRKAFATAKVSRTGTFTVKLARPVADEQYALFRVSAKVGNQRTFTLPIAVRPAGK